MEALKARCEALKPEQASSLLALSVDDMTDEEVMKLCKKLGKKKHQKNQEDSDAAEELALKKKIKEHHESQDDADAEDALLLAREDDEERPKCEKKEEMKAAAKEYLQSLGYNSKEDVMALDDEER